MAIENTPPENITDEFDKEENPYVSVPSISPKPVAAYQEHLGAIDVTDEQATALIGVIFDIMRTMVDINLDLNSVQFTVDENPTLTTSNAIYELGSGRSKKQRVFNGAADDVMATSNKTERSPS